MPTPKELSRWDPSWPQEFEQARSSLLWAGEGYIHAVEHVGATAIPGSPACPMIDLVAIVAEEADLDAVTPYILGSNYQEFPFPYPTSDRTARYFEKDRGSEIGHTIQLVTAGSVIRRQAVRLRDWLVTHLDDAQRLVDTKSQNLARYNCHPEAYADGKHIFFLHILEQAEASGPT